MSRNDTCHVADSRCAEGPEGQHVMLTMYRLPWPWGVMLPQVRRCLACGQRQHRSWWSTVKARFT